MNSYFLEKAACNEPEIYQKEIQPVRFGVPVPDASKWFKYRFEERQESDSLIAGESVYVDFGDHYTGHLSFQMSEVGLYPDSPIKVHIKFAENLYELEYDFDSYNDGLVSSWLQEEILYIDAPTVVKLPRRYAFRYVKLTMDERGFRRGPMKFTDFRITATTSAETSACKPIMADTELADIDRIGCKTLEECMQRVFEDGPKRDRRLWVGDLRIQALTGYYTHPSENTMKMVKKCLYLCAAYTESGQRVLQSVMEDANGTHAEPYFLTDYSLLFAVTLCDYYEHTGDNEVVDDLFAVADEQLRIAWNDSEDCIVRDKEGWWTFIDWCSDLKKVTSLQGVLLYTLRKMITLCEKTGRIEPAREYTEKWQAFCNAAQKELYDEKSGYFQNAHDENQLSVHSQVWMVLGGVVDKEKARELLQRALKNDEITSVVSPYMHHYVLEALFEADMQKEALEYIKAYWGEMVKREADTYWEVFVPDDFYASPYNNPVMNSSCHAWSCSASYFIRKYFV